MRYNVDLNKEEYDNNDNMSKGNDYGGSDNVVTEHSGQWYVDAVSQYG